MGNSVISACSGTKDFIEANGNDWAPVTRGTHAIRQLNTKVTLEVVHDTFTRDENNQVLKHNSDTIATIYTYKEVIDILAKGTPSISRKREVDEDTGTLRILPDHYVWVICNALEQADTSILTAAVNSISQTLAFIEKNISRINPAQGVPSFVLSCFPVVHPTQSSSVELGVAQAAELMLVEASFATQFRFNIVDVFSNNPVELTYGDGTHVVPGETPSETHTSPFVFSRLKYFDGFKGLGGRLNNQWLTSPKTDSDVIHFTDPVVEQIVRGRFASTQELVSHLRTLKKQGTGASKETAKQRFEREVKELQNQRSVVKRETEGEVRSQVGVHEDAITSAERRIAESCSTLSNSYNLTYPRKNEKQIAALVNLYEEAAATGDNSKISNLALQEALRASAAILKKEVEDADRLNASKTPYYRREFTLQGGCCRSAKQGVYYIPREASAAEAARAEQAAERHIRETGVNAPLPANGYVVTEARVEISDAIRSSQDATVAQFRSQLAGMSPDQQSSVSGEVNKIEMLYLNIAEHKHKIKVVQASSEALVKARLVDLDQQIAVKSKNASEAPSIDYATGSTGQYPSGDLQKDSNCNTDFFRAALTCYGHAGIVQQLTVYFALTDAKATPEEAFSQLAEEFEQLHSETAIRALADLVDRYPITHLSRFETIAKALEKKIKSNQYYWSDRTVFDERHPLVALFPVLVAADVHYGDALFPFSRLGDSSEHLRTLREGVRVPIFRELLDDKTIDRIKFSAYANPHFFALASHMCAMNHERLFKFLIPRIPFLFPLNKFTGHQLSLITEQKHRVVFIKGSTRAPSDVKTVEKASPSSKSPGAHTASRGRVLPVISEYQGAEEKWTLNATEYVAESVHKDQAYLIVRCFRDGEEIDRSVMDRVINTRTAKALTTDYSNI